jgi:hypothetical protein
MTTYLGPHSMELPASEDAAEREPFTITPGMPGELKRRLLEKIQPGDAVSISGAPPQIVETKPALSRAIFKGATPEWNLLRFLETDYLKVRPNNG